MGFAKSLGELSEKQLRMVAPRERRGHLTKDEAQDKNIGRREKELQNQVVGMLRRNGIYPIVNRFGKKTTTNVGCPDILFAAHGKFVGSFAFAWEFKIPPNDLSSAQLRLKVEMTQKPNAWRHDMIVSYGQAVEILKALGII
jgi:hypothetical protein